MKYNFLIRSERDIHAWLHRKRLSKTGYDIEFRRLSDALKKNPVGFLIHSDGYIEKVV